MPTKRAYVDTTCTKILHLLNGPAIDMVALPLRSSSLLGARSLVPYGDPLTPLPLSVALCLELGFETSCCTPVEWCGTAQDRA